MTNQTSELEDWNTLRSQNWEQILIGNGASQAVWNRFGYTSLYQEACSQEISNPLLEEDKRLFEAENSKNFEKILSNLLIARSVNQILGSPEESDIQVSIRQRYRNIQKALIQAVRAVHVPWINFEEAIKTAIRSELINYKNVYSTNYDLLTYWSRMSSNLNQFRDFFWNLDDEADTYFDFSNVGERNDRTTNIFYIHGAIQIYRDLRTNKTRKIRYSGTDNILDLFDSRWSFESQSVPLFVSEGTWQEKLESISRYDYLSFAYSRFRDSSGNLVIFGHSLSEEYDGHLVKAIKDSGITRIAISIRSSNSPHEIIAIKNRMHRILQNPRQEKQFVFFDAQTHPLGDTSLDLTSLQNPNAVN